MIQWLQQYSGNGIHGVNIERAELQTLRKELKHYKKKYEKEDKEIIIVSDNEDFDNQEDQDLIDEIIRKKQQKRKGLPQTISDDVLSEEDLLNLQNFRPHIEEKSQENYEIIRNKCKSLFFFNNLSEDELYLIINSFKTERYKKGEKIFTEGSKADKLYILYRGELECWKTIKPGDPMTFIKTYKEGDSLGEIALLYNYIRKHTIIDKSDDVVLFSLDRRDYKGIIQRNELIQREKYKNVLKSIDIFQNLTEAEFGKVCDIMEEREFKAGEEIMKPNENEDEFIILFEGNCHSEKISDTGKASQVLKEFESFDYFGDAPWFKSEPRNYSVKADSDCVVFIISRIEFKRLIGSLENILKRKMESYQKYMKK